MKIREEEPIIVLRPVLSGPKGKCRIEMALDTGVPFTMISWNIAEKLGYDPDLSKRGTHLVTASTTEEVPLITIKSIKLMDLR